MQFPQNLENIKFQFLFCYIYYMCMTRARSVVMQDTIASEDWEVNN